MKITYKTLYKSDTIEKKIQEELTSLTIDAHTSYFQNETKYIIDSLYQIATRQFEKTGIVPNVSLKYKLNTFIFKDFEQKKINIFNNVRNRTFSYPIAMPVMKWEIEKERKEVLGFECKKATTHFGGRKWEAWFASELSFQDGPYKFHGLPGLILEIYDTEGDYMFSAIELKKINQKLDVNKIPSIKTTREKYQELKSKIIKDPSMYTRALLMRNKNQMGVITSKDSNGNVMTEKDIFQRVDKEFYDFMRSHNNPIEKGDIWVK